MKKHIKIKNEKESILVQELLFNNGYKWASGDSLYFTPFENKFNLIMDIDLNILTYCVRSGECLCCSLKYKEISIEELKNYEKTSWNIVKELTMKKVNNKKYSTSLWKWRTY